MITVHRRIDNHLDILQIWENTTNWCVKNFGDPDIRESGWDYTIQFDFIEFYFTNSRDAVVFILKEM
jgi:hypothetical protein